MKYHYSAKVVSCYDGDTIRVDLDLGCGIWFKNEPIRLYGINTPEVRGEEREEGLVVRDWLRHRILNKTILLQTIKDKKGKYGRLLGVIKEIEGEEPLERTINDELVFLGMAKEADY